MITKVLKNWYLLVQGKVKGPFSYSQIVNKIRSGEVTANIYIKAVNQEEWGGLKDHEIFMEELIYVEQLAVSRETQNQLGRRQHSRHFILADIFIKKESNLLKLKALDIAKGGISAIGETECAELGDILDLYCSPVLETLAFSCKVRVINKRVHKKSNLYRYGMEFLKISSKGKEFLSGIQEEINKKVA